MSAYRDDALARLDVASFLAGQGLELRKINESEYSFRCPFHDDQHASANVNLGTGLWFCHTCNEGGSPIDFLMKKGLTYKQSLAEVGRASGMEPPGSRVNGNAGAPTPAKPSSKLTEENISAWHEAAKRNPDLMRWFAERRGYTVETVDKWQLGWDGQRVTIPVRDGAGALVNVRRYKREATGTQGKMIGLEPGLNKARLFPLDVPLPEDVLLVEGEWDMILAHQHGFTNTVTVTSGAGTWDAEFTPYFEGRRVTIAYDNDEAGRNGAQRIARILSDSAAVHVLHVPNLPDKGDITDFFVEQQRSADELRSLVLDASPYVAAPAIEEEPPPIPVALHHASHAQYRGQRLEMSVMLSGKAMTPYTIPWEFDFDCGMNNKKYCGACPMMEVNGHRAVRVSAGDPATLALINVTSSAQYSALRNLAKAHPACSYGVPTVKSSVNVEEMRLIAELDAEAHSGESEYVNRTGYFLGHGLLPNRSYRMLGYSHPLPKTQATVHVINEAIPSQDNISAFVVTPESHALLAVFRPGDGQSIETKWTEVYDDMRQHVHRIQGRLDMQIAYDLAWHSVTDFYFNGAYVRRGWVEVMVMGDSGQGKAICYNTGVYTPYGWRMIGDLVVGDEVFGVDGRPHRVLGVYPQGRRPLFRVTFTDGAWIDTDAEHLWATTTSNREYKRARAAEPRSERWQVLTTAQIAARGLRRGVGHKTFVPLAAPAEMPKADLPLDPYTLGVLIGDGSLTRTPLQVTTDDETIEQLRFPGGVRARHLRRLTATVSVYDLTRPLADNRGPNPLARALFDLGLMGAYSAAKFVPKRYLHGSPVQRLAILQGLLDTDGHVARGRVSFSTSSRQLAADVQQLVWSLAGTATVREHGVRAGHFELSIRLPGGTCPFRLGRRIAAWRPRERYQPSRAIVSIEPLGEDDMVCIAIDSPDHLYVAKDYIVTHNTEMAMNLLSHYQMGERVQGEQSSVAGLMGGLEKLGDTWMLSWGRLPLNDKRLVVIDETQGLHPSAVESLSDVRATGVAEITKIRTERTHSRCRIVWLANPPSGNTLAQHNQGVQAIRDLFKKPEDIRRLDFAITVASGDVDTERAINVRYRESGALRFTSEACRTLVLWAWSRRTDQVVFTDEATDLILSTATEMGRRYHPAIPLVEPADQRLKIARLSVAAAARVHSTDPAGEQIIVAPEHVRFVVGFLDRIYNASSMSYGEYSAQQRGQEELDDDTEAGIRDEINRWQSSDTAMAFFRQAGVFKKSELADVVGWDEAYAKAQLKYLAGHRLIKTTRDGYRKTPVFIALLRGILNGPAGTADLDDEGAPF